MTKKYFLQIVVFFLSLNFLLAQQPPTLYMPRDVSLAYKNGTRNADGSTARFYWQNYAHYQIEMKINPPNRNIFGHEKITYINNSPDSLHTLVFSLIQNAHLPQCARNTDVDSAYFSHGFIIDSFFINGIKTEWKNPVSNFTRNKIHLLKPIATDDSIKIYFVWHYLLTASTNNQPREGVVDSTTFFLAYFYPRIAVFDDYQGWDELNFTELQEFYNDFCDYDFNVTLPKNFVMWSTGELLNANEVLQPEINKRLQIALATDSIIHIATAKENFLQQVTLQNKFNTWKWRAENVTDLAIGVSNHYLWDATSVDVDSVSHRRVSVQAAYDSSSHDFANVTKVAQFSVYNLSHVMPGVPYPYPKMTVFNGLSAMEYPMMVNDFTDDDFNDMQSLTNHEVAHTYFPFFMGINESRYAFMDEGWAAFFELYLTRLEMPKVVADKMWTDFYVKRWLNNNSPGVDLPIITPSNEMQDPSYERNSYGKPALAYLALQDLLGKELFKKCLDEFIDRWNGKHPLPYDFFNTINTVSGQNLNWFFENCFFENNFNDLKIADVFLFKGGARIDLSNPGGYAVPFDLRITFLDKTSETIHYTPAIWKEVSLKPVEKRNIRIMFNNADKKDITTIEILHDVFLDKEKKGDSW